MLSGAVLWYAKAPTPVRGACGRGTAELSLGGLVAARKAPWRRPGYLALALCLVAFFAAAWVATAIFDRLPHVEDDVAFLFQAKTLASGRLFAASPPRPEFFEIPFVLNKDGLWFGKYPPGYPAVLALGVIAGQPWLLNPLVAALCTGLVYLLGRRLYGPATALLAAGLLVTSPFFLLQAGSFMSHVVCLFWTLVFTLLFHSAVRRHSRSLAALAGVAMGMLFLSRPLTAVGVGAPYAFGAVYVLLLRRRHLGPLLALLGGFLPFVGAFLGYNYLTTGDLWRTAYELYWPYDRIGFGPGLGTLGYHGWDEALLNTRVNLAALSDYLFGWPLRSSLLPSLLALGVAGWRLARPLRLHRDEAAHVADVGAGSGLRPEAADLLLFTVVASLVLVHFAYWTPGQMYGPRYYFEAMGALVLLSARGLLLVWRGVAAITARLRSAHGNARVVASVGTLLLMVTLYGHSYFNFTAAEFARTVRWYDIDASGLRVVWQADVHKAVVFVKRGYWTDYAPFFSQNTPDLAGDVVYAIDLGPQRNRELMALYPGRSFYRFAGGQLTPLTN